MVDIKLLALLLSSILFINFIVTWLLYLKNKSHYKYLCLGWAYFSLSIFLQGLGAAHSAFMHILAFGTMFGASLMFSKLLLSLVNQKLSPIKFLIIHTASILLTVILNFYAVDPNYLAIAISVSNSLPMFYSALKVISLKKTKLNFMHFLCALALIMQAIHCLDFAYAFNKPELAKYGYIFAVVFVFAISIFFFGAVVESISRENTRVRLEAQLGANMVNSAKMASIGELASGVTHEINNPVQLIKGMAIMLEEMILSNNINKEEASDILKRVVKASNRITNITSLLRNLANGPGYDTIEAVRLSDLVERTTTLFTAVFQQNKIALLIDELDESVKVKCRYSEVCQVMVNLIGNDKDATMEIDDRWIRVSFKYTNEYVYINIEDSGKGVE